jgi:hypothetical protein
MKKVRLLYSYELFGRPMSDELIGAFTSGSAFKRYLSSLKKDGKLEKEDIALLLKRGETAKLDPNYKIMELPLNPEYKPEKLKAE